MNPNYNTKLIKNEINANNVHEAKELIINTIKSGKQTFWPEISRANDGKYSFDEIQEAKKQLLIDGVIRMREDDSEHGWEWIFVK